MTAKKINIRVLPRSSRDEVVGEMSNGALKVKLTAPPVEGRANEELIRLLAGYFGITKSKIRIVSGRSSKNKVVEIK